MKKITSIYKVILILALAKINILTIVAQDYIEKETIVKSFVAKPNTTVDISNKYGKVHVVTWDKEEVKFQVELEVASSNPSKARKVRDNFDVEFTRTKYYVIAKTEFYNSYQSIISDIMNLFPVNSSVKIDYTVYVPSGIYLNLNNKYGDIYIDDFNGELSVTMSHGSFMANKLTMADLNFSFTDASINELAEGKLNASYSNIDVKKCTGELNLDSKASKIKLDEVKRIKLNSKNDDADISSLERLTGEAYFSNIHLGDLHEEASYTLKYGNFSIEKIKKGFSFVNLITNYSDIDLIFDFGTTYDVDFTYHKDVSLLYPREQAVLEEKVINEEEGLVNMYGKKGASDGSSKLKINAPKKCNIRIIHR